MGQVASSLSTIGTQLAAQLHGHLGINFDLDLHREFLAQY